MIRLSAIVKKLAVFTLNDNLNIKYCMGSGLSQDLLEYEDENEKPKNFNYYFNNQRSFRVSRRHYPQYTRGYFYGYWEDLDYWDNLANQENPKEIEREF